MKKLALTFAFSFIGYLGFAQTSTYVNPYTKSNGTYVEGYQRSLPNHTNTDNFSTQGNSNPFNGNIGTKPRDYSIESQQLRQDHNIQTGPRGGQYYINSHGNKTYVPKNK